MCARLSTRARVRQPSIGNPSLATECVHVHDVHAGLHFDDVRARHDGHASLRKPSAAPALQYNHERVVPAFPIDAAFCCCLRPGPVYGLRRRRRRSAAARLNKRVRSIGEGGRKWSVITALSKAERSLRQTIAGKRSPREEYTTARAGNNNRLVMRCKVGRKKENGISSAHGAR